MQRNAAPQLPFIMTAVRPRQGMSMLLPSAWGMGAKETPSFLGSGPARTD